MTQFNTNQQDDCRLDNNNNKHWHINLNTSSQKPLHYNITSKKQNSRHHVMNNSQSENALSVKSDALLKSLENVWYCCENLRLTNHAEQIYKRSNGFKSKPLRVVVFGEFNRGKSTLINALLGRQLLKAKLVPTTGTITHLCYSEIEKLEVHHRDGHITSHQLNELEGLTTLDPSGTDRSNVTKVVVKVHNSFLKTGVEIIDTPGVAEHEGRTQIAIAAIAEADIILFLLDARQLLNDTERNEIIALHNNLKKPILPIINFMNQVDEPHIPEVRYLLSQWCRNLPNTFGRAWFEVNAIGALKAVIANGTPQTDDFAALRQALFGMNADERLQIQHHSRLNQITYDLASVEKDNHDRLTYLTNAKNLAQTEYDDKRLCLEHQVNQFDGNWKALLKSQLSSAAVELTNSLNYLNLWLDGFDGINIELRLPREYSETLARRTRSIEINAHLALLEFVENGTTRPEPLTICENMALAAKIQVNPQSTIPASMSEAGGGQLIGTIIGTIIMPGLGTIAGAAVGRCLANWFCEKTINPIEIARKQVQETWEQDGRQFLHQLENQLDARGRMIREELQTKLDDLRLALPIDEITQRQWLSHEIKECQRLCEQALVEGP